MIEIGPHEQLFLDDYLIERAENTRCRVNRAARNPGRPVLTGDRPWEGGVALFGTVLYDPEEGAFKMWYLCGGGHVAYAVSGDGLVWEKPEFDGVRRDGRKTNIVIERGLFGCYYEFFGVIRDERESDPDRRYKMAFVSMQRPYSGPYEDPYHPGSRRGLGTAVSADGIRWTLEDEFASHEICDISRFFQDPVTGRIVLYGRTKLTPEKNDGRWRSWGWARAVTRIESEDFRDWSKGEFVLAADGEDPEGSEIYSMAAFVYGDLTIGMVQMFYGLPDQCRLDIQLAGSRDGRAFTRVSPRDPFISEGEIGAWDRFNIALGCMLPVTVGDEWWFYYSGRSYRHSPYSGADSGPKTGSIGLARVKRGRFVSLESSFDGGTVLTKPLSLEGSRLSVNANAAFGSVRVALLEGGERPLSECIVQGEDGVDIPVRFEGVDSGSLTGKPVRIRFDLSNAQLFGFTVRG